MMRRRHENGGGEVAMMAVITKAMGAFLILMIMLLPYYTGDTRSQQTVEDTKQRIDDAKTSLDSAVDRLKKGRLTDEEIDDLLKRLTQVRDELAEAQTLISQLKMQVDQAASQINRLEQQNAQLQSQLAALQAEVEELRKEIARLRAIDTAALQARIRELENQVAQLSAELDALKTTLNTALTRLAAAEAENKALRDEIARLRAIDTAALQARIQALENSIAQLRAEAVALKKTLNDALSTLATAEAENKALRQIARRSQAIFAVSRCDVPAEMEVEIPTINPETVVRGSIAQVVDSALPWKQPPRRPGEPGPPLFPGDISNTALTGLNLPYNPNDDLVFDVFITVKISDRLLQSILASSPKDNGIVTSSKGQPTCSVTVFASLQGAVTRLGTYKLGAAEPVVFVQRVYYKPNGVLTASTEQRPGIQQAIAEAVCTHSPPFCQLARRHAAWRVKGSDPWWNEDRDPDARPSPPPPSPLQDRTITPK
ncbi:hypothetical protein [Xanthobacter autotrophicus]|uniref:hypothetical protein n=1 Tax=Xanthobacter autotrophicus TaxID=280 RepID=UPI003727E495